MDIEEIRTLMELTVKRQERPFIMVNVAASMDGKIALKGGKRIRLSTEEDFARVHRLRNGMDAILVGVNTVISDDPSLLVKERFVNGRPRHPVRIVLDSTGKLPSSSRVLNDDAPTLIAVGNGSRPRDDRAGNDGNIPGPDRVEVPVDDSGLLDLAFLFRLLYDRRIRSILIEGGSRVISYILGRGYYDVFTIFYRNVVIGGIEAPSIAGLPGARNKEEAISLGPPDLTPMKDGFVVTFRNENAWSLP